MITNNPKQKHIFMQIFKINNACLLFMIQNKGIHIMWGNSILKVQNEYSWEWRDKTPWKDKGKMSWYFFRIWVFWKLSSITLQYFRERKNNKWKSRNEILLYLYCCLLLDPNFLLRILCYVFLSFPELHLDLS